MTNQTLNEAITMMELAQRVVGRMDHAEVHESAVLACFDLYIADQAKFIEDMKAEQPVKMNMVCGHCGSTDVKRDAWAHWEVEVQEWVLSDVYDHSYCCTCEGECSIVEEGCKE